MEMREVEQVLVCKNNNCLHWYLGVYAMFLRWQLG